MSIYAYEPGLGQILVVWPAGIGSSARLVTPVTEQRAGELCGALTTLSQAVWATYAQPASSAADDDERLRREEERDSRDQVLEALRVPNLPDEFGLLVISYTAVEESAHRVGRLLHGLGDPELTDAVVADAVTEIDAVVRAELGDLSGRAAQATALDRLDVSPVQVAAADELLRADLLGDALLTALVDPAAACVAAARWLVAAAVVAAEAAGIEAADVFAEADNIEPVPVTVPTEVVTRIVDDELDAREVVLTLLRTAVAAGDGVILVPQDGAPGSGSGPVRATELDPRRPARDLLEHLLDGITACHLLYADFDPADELDPALEAGHRDRIAEEFIDRVRTQAG